VLCRAHHAEVTAQQATERAAARRRAHHAEVTAQQATERAAARRTLREGSDSTI
jgi:hypothetical protein